MSMYFNYSTSFKTYTYHYLLLQIIMHAIFSSGFYDWGDLNKRYTVYEKNTQQICPSKTLNAIAATCYTYDNFINFCSLILWRRVDEFPPPGHYDSIMRVVIGTRYQCMLDAFKLVIVLKMWIKSKVIYLVKMYRQIL